jgi:hypothetical protein
MEISYVNQKKVTVVDFHFVSVLEGIFLEDETTPQTFSLVQCGHSHFLGGWKRST